MNRSVWLPLIMIFGLGFPSFSQETEPAPDPTPEVSSRKMPGIPGAFVLEFGFNLPFDKPDTFDISFWGSRTVNVYYQYDKRIGTSKFSVHPGVGFSLERYKLSNDYTLVDVPPGSALVPASDIYPGIKKSMIITNYFEIPLEFRFSTNPDDPTRSFRVSVGGRAGYLFDSYTKIKYREEGQTKKIKDKQDYALNPFRFGASLKFGIGNLNLFSYYNFTPLFESGEGPQDTEMNNFTIGISVSSF